MYITNSPTLIASYGDYFLLGSQSQGMGSGIFLQQE